MKLILYQFDECPYCQKVQRVIQELNLEVEMRNTRKNPKWREDLIAFNGKTQVPCLVVDNKPMLESDDIVAFLREKFNAPK